MAMVVSTKPTSAPRYRSMSLAISGNCRNVGSFIYRTFAGRPPELLGHSSMKWLFESAIILLCVLYAEYLVIGDNHLASSLLGRLAIGLVAGLVIGWLIVGLKRLILWCTRWFSKKMPRTAFYLGTGLFWLGIAVGAFCVGTAGYVGFSSVLVLSTVWPDGPFDTRSGPWRTYPLRMQLLGVCYPAGVYLRTNQTSEISARPRSNERSRFLSRSLGP
jgi:hypothetical protein